MKGFFESKEYQIRKGEVRKSEEPKRKKLSSINDESVRASEDWVESSRYSYQGVNHGYNEQYMVGHWWSEQD